MKVKEAKKLQNVFKSNLNELSRGRNKSEEQKLALKNIILLYKSREAVIKLFNGYSSIVSETKYKTTHGKGIPSMFAGVASVSKASDHSNLKILSPTKMLQRLPIAFAQLKTGNAFQNLLNEIRQMIYSLHQKKEITEKVYNNIMNSIKL